MVSSIIYVPLTMVIVQMTLKTEKKNKCSRKDIDKTEHVFYTCSYIKENNPIMQYERQVIRMEAILESYYADNAKKLHNMVDKILSRLGFAGLVDCEDFYSLANEVFVDVMRRYEESQSFEGFLYSCLSNKFKTEMTKRNRQKRQADQMCVSIDTPVGEEEGITLGDVIADEFSVESSIFEENEACYSERVSFYLNRLSRLQREVLRLSSIGYLPGEIKAELHINEKQYSDCCKAIHSYRNISILF